GLAGAAVVRTDRADERAGLKPLAAEHRIRGGRRGDDDLLSRGLALLGRLRVQATAEVFQPLAGAAVREDTLDRRHGRPDRGDLALGLPAAADHPKSLRARAREVLRSDAARRSGAELPEPVGLDHRRELGPAGLEELHYEAHVVEASECGI